MTEETKPGTPGSSKPTGAEDGPLDSSSTEAKGTASQQQGAGSAPAETEEAGPAETPDPLSQARAEAARFKDQLLRTAADFDNFRKRTRRELEDAERRGRDDLLKELLPVFDNLERATAHTQTADSSGEAKALLEGIDLVMRQFADTLRKLGIERVSSVGQPFDPAVHEAIQHMETAEFAPGVIAAEVQPGYRTAERLVRPALVVVAKAPVSATPNDSAPSNDAPDDASGAADTPH